MRILAGFALLNRNTNSLPGGYGSGETRGQLLLHELGHAMGLEHTSAKSQIMYPTLLNRSRTTYGDGDRTGLDKLGRQAGCIN
jgi:predicted Zn-dependent protease